MYSVNIYHFVSYCHDNIDSMISKVEVIRKEFFLNDQLYYGVKVSNYIFKL